MERSIKRKYRPASNRMPGWEYDRNGYYFLTFLTQNREQVLGTIEDGKMILSDWGKIVEEEFLKSFEIRKELRLDEYVIMPDHMHAIVILLNKDIETQEVNEQKSKLERKPKSISSFIAGFKSAVNSKIDDDIDKKGLDIPKYNRKNHFFQLNYHDKIIRSHKELINVQRYIRSNPKNWKNGKSEGLGR